MTISTTTSRIRYAGNGVTSIFSAPWKILAAANLQVTLVSAAGVPAVKTLSTDYTISGATTDAASVTMLTPPALGEILVLRTLLPVTQTTAYATAGTFPSASHEAALDKLTLEAQRLEDLGNRGIHFPYWDAVGLDGTLPAAAARAGLALAFDSQGRPVCVPIGEGGGGGSASGATATGALINRTLADHFADILNVDDYGALGDGATDDTTAIQLALNRIAVLGRGTLRFNPKTYKIAGALTIPSGATLDLNGATLDCSTSTTSPIFDISGTAGTPKSLTVNATAGSRSLTVASTTGIVAGSMLRVYSTKAYDPGRTDSYAGEMVFVESVTSTVITTTTDLLDDYATADGAAIELVTPTQNVRICNGRILGNTTAQSTNYCMTFYRARFCLVENMTFDEFDLAHLRFRDSVHCHVRGSNFLRARPSSQGYGVSFYDASQDCSVTHCTFIRCRHSLSTNNSATYGGVVRRILFESNYVLDSEPSSGGTGGDAIDTHAAADDIIIRNNVVIGASGQGINAECSSVIVEGNLIIEAGDNGIGLHNETGHTGRVVVRGNIVRDAGNVGISVRPGSGAAAIGYSSAVVVGNLVDGAVAQGIFVVGRTTSALLRAAINDNIVRNTLAVTGAIYLSLVDQFSVAGNVAETAVVSQQGIRIDKCRYGAVTGNAIALISAATGGGVNLTAATLADTDRVIVDGNVVTSPSPSASKGLSLETNCTNVTVGINDFGQCTSLISPTSLTIASDTITLSYVPVGGLLVVDTEGAAASDNLATLSGGYAGLQMTLRSSNAARDVTVKNGTGNIFLAGSDMVLDNPRDTLTVIKSSTGEWLEVARANNGA